MSMAADYYGRPYVVPILIRFKMFLHVFVGFFFFWVVVVVFLKTT